MTAAPGPQQPDEVCVKACVWHNGLYWHETFCPCWVRGLSLCPCAQQSRPAAPSAQPDEVRRGSLRAQQQLDDLRAENERPSRLGCSLVAHRDLAFCSSCAGVDAAEELYGWRLLAIAERGVPAQPVRDTEEGRR